MSAVRDRLGGLVRTAQARESSGAPALKTVPNVPIVSTGTYSLAGNPYPGGETTFTQDDLADAVAAVDDPAVSLPRLKLGHTSSWGDAEPAFGKLDNLRIGDNGQTIYGDYVGVPAWLADIMPTVYPSRSIEAAFNVETPTGKEYRMVISALALLGVVMPGVATLNDLPGVFSDVMPEGVVIETEDETVVANTGGEMGLKARLRREAEGSVNSEDVRRAYYDGLSGDQWMWWIRALYLDPNELIVDDDDGNLYRVPFTINGEEVEFGDATEVKIQYVTARGDSRQRETALSPETADLVYASRSESRPESNDKEDQMDSKEIRNLLGLSEDATDEEVRQKLEERSETPPSTKEPGQSEGNPAEQGPETGTPSEGNDNDESGSESEETKTENAGEPVAAGTVTTDPETLAQLQRDAAAGRQARDAQLRRERETLVENAIKAGKFPPARRDHWLTSLKHDPEGAKAAIESLADGLVPVEEQGAAPSDEQLATASYPEEWLSPAERARKQGKNDPTITQEVS
jgi:hypothetical protein